MTIIFFTIYPLNEDYGIKYGFDIFKKRGFNIVILNVFKYLFDDRFSEYQRQYGELDSVMGIEQISIGSERDFEKYFDNILGWKIGIPLLGYWDEKFLKLIVRTKIDYIIGNAWHHPTYSGSEPFFARFSRFLVRIFRDLVGTIRKSVFWKIKMLIARRFNLFGFRHPKYYIAGTEVYPFRISTSNTTVIPAHSLDYDRFLRNKGKPRSVDIPGYEYYVFIADSPWGEHDHYLWEKPSYITKQKYSALVNKFLSLVEVKTGRKVVISAHPKYSSNDDIYDGRPFLYDTEQLIKYSSGVISHFSGAIKFAVLHDKPLCFISLWEMKDDYHFQEMIKAYAFEMKAPIYYIDKNDSLSEMTRNGFFYYDSNAYKKFTRKYINPGNCVDRLLWDIVADTLSKDYALD